MEKELSTKEKISLKEKELEVLKRVCEKEDYFKDVVITLENNILKDVVGLEYESKNGKTIQISFKLNDRIFEVFVNLTQSNTMSVNFDIAKKISDIISDEVIRNLIVNFK